MGHYNIHFSPTGGTKKVADIICVTLEGDFNEIDLCCNIEQTSLNEEDICLVSVPSYGGRVPATAIERLKKIAGNGAKAVLNCVYGNRAWEDTLTELQDTLEEQGFRCVAALATVAEHSIFRQFATDRPDKKDKTEVIEMAGKVQERPSDGSHRFLPRKPRKLSTTSRAYRKKLYLCTPFEEKGPNCGSSSVGRASAFQAEGRGFEPRLPLPS